MENKNNSKQNTSGSQPKKSIVIRVLILIVAALMFIGAIAIPFMASGSFKY